jgi:hypothetical protein
VFPCSSTRDEGLQKNPCLDHLHWRCASKIVMMPLTDCQSATRQPIQQEQIHFELQILGTQGLRLGFVMNYNSITALAICKGVEGLKCTWQILTASAFGKFGLVDFRDFGKFGLVDFRVNFRDLETQIGTLNACPHIGARILHKNFRRKFASRSWTSSPAL